MKEGKKKEEAEGGVERRGSMKERKKKEEAEGGEKKEE